MKRFTFRNRVTGGTYIKIDSALPEIISEWGNSEELDMSEEVLSYDEELAFIRESRAREYPPIGDQLDAGFHARNGDLSAQEAIDAQILAVKAKYPKPVPPSGAPDEPAQGD